MPTPLRHLFATPAECARSTAGPIIAHDFKQADAVECYKNGLSMVGTVPVRRRIGAIYPGVNANYWQINNTGGRIKAARSIVLEFWPEFDWNYDVTQYFLDTDGAGERILFIHYNLATNSELRVYAGTGATLILQAASAAYSSYWRPYQRNVIVISMISGNNAMYLNGNSVASSATAWVAGDMSAIRLGASSAGTLTMYGRYGAYKLFSGNVAADLLTLADAQAYWKNEI